MRRISEVIAAAATVLLAFPVPVEACTFRLLTVDVDPWSGPTEIPLEGVVVLSATDRGGPTPAVRVRDEAGDVVGGQLSSVRLRASPSYPPILRRIGWVPSDTPMLLVWQADAPLVPGARYTVDVVNRSPSRAFPPVELTAAALPFAGLAAPPAIAELSAERSLVSKRNVAVCDESTYGSGGCPECWFDDLEERTDVIAELPVSFFDRYSFQRLVSDTGAPISRAGFAFGGAREGTRRARLSFHSAAEYCAHFESVSLIDGSVLAGPTACLSEAEVAPLAGDGTEISGCSIHRGTSSCYGGAPLLGLLLALRRRRAGTRTRGDA